VVGKGADEALIGRTIAGKFAIESYLGGGAMGAVYRARQTALEKTVALKVLHRELAQDAGFIMRFQREAKAASRLDHPNSMRVIDYGAEADGVLYIAMEYLDGRDLLKVILEDWPLSANRIAGIMMQALAALAVAHDLGIVHRDLKPENIMILKGTNDEGQQTDVVKVCDFGIAKMTTRSPVDSQSSAKGPLTTQGLVVGTPEYMSPEQGKGESLDSRSDLYSAGVILYQLLTGRVPFEAESALGVVMKHVMEEPTLPSSINRTIDKRLETICLRAMRKRREDRQQTAREMRAELRAVLENAVSAVATPFPSAESAPRLVDAATVAASAPGFGLAVAGLADSAGALPIAVTQGGGPLTPPLQAEGAQGTDVQTVPRSSSTRTPGGTATSTVDFVIKKRPIWPWIAAGAVALGSVGSATVVLRSADPPAAPATAAGSAALADTPLASDSAPAELAPAAPSATPSTSAARRGAPVPHPAGALRAAGGPAGDPAASSSKPAVVAPPAAPSVPTPTPAGSAPTAFDVTKATAVTNITNAAGVAARDVRSALPMPRFTNCYRDALKTGGKRLEGKMTVHIQADATGVVTTALLSGPESLVKGMGSCVTESFNHLPLGNVPSTGATADIDITFKPE
jgi:hypothetical protein